MTGIQKAFVFLLSATATAGGTFAVYAGGRVRPVPTAPVERAAPAPPAFAMSMRQAAPDGTGADSPRSFGDLEPAVVADLRQEGIDLSAIAEFRSMLRDAVTPGDVAEKMKRLISLQYRLMHPALDGPDPAVTPAGFRASCAAVARAGGDAVEVVVDSVTGAWDRLIHELDL